MYTNGKMSNGNMLNSDMTDRGPYIVYNAVEQGAATIIPKNRQA
jgi:hypothetical protein